MADKKLIIRIAPDGSIVVEADGYVGPACQEIVEKYARLLGKETAREVKAEFHATVDETETIQVGGAEW